MRRLRVGLQKVLLIGLSLGLVVPDVKVVAQETKETLEESFYKALREGEQLFYQGDFEAAKQKFREVFLIAEKIPEKIPEPVYVGSLKMEGLCYQYLDELDQALTLFHEALRIHEMVGPKSGIADALNIIGWALYLKGEYEQALALAEGLTRTSAKGQARIIRTEESSGQRTEIPIDLGKILAGKNPDPMLQPRDIVFVPNSAARSALYRSAEAAISVVSGVIIWRR